MKGIFNSQTCTTRKTKFQNSAVESSSCPKQKLAHGVWASCLAVGNGMASQVNTAVLTEQLCSRQTVAGGEPSASEAGRATQPCSPTGTTGECQATPRRSIGGPGAGNHQRKQVLYPPKADIPSTGPCLQDSTTNPVSFQSFSPVFSKHFGEEGEGY